jgi:hypothetical protein
MPVTNANMQENSTRSITSLVICTLPDCAVPRASPLQATPETWPKGDGGCPNFSNGRRICGLAHGLVFRYNSASGKSEDVLILQANRRACTSRETAARLERELARVGVASAPGWAGASLTSLPRCIRPELRSALTSPVSPSTYSFIGRRSNEADHLVQEDVGALCRSAPLLKSSVGAESWRPDLPKIRDGHPEPLARCGLHLTTAPRPKSDTL